jgi:NAD(P)-dependent dehydrogenase (short-subunit alcohol dehydrogenase family)
MSTDPKQSLNYFSMCFTIFLERILTLVSSVSGANRGIGYQLVLAILERQPDAVIFAGARDPAKANELNNLASKNPNVHVVKLVADDEESNKKAVDEIKKVTDRLDVVVANAGKSELPGGSSPGRAHLCSSQV